MPYIIYNSMRHLNPFTVSVDRVDRYLRPVQHALLVCLLLFTMPVAYGQQAHPLLGSARFGLPQLQQLTQNAGQSSFLTLALLTTACSDPAGAVNAADRRLLRDR